MSTRWFILDEDSVTPWRIEPTRRAALGWALRYLDMSGVRERRRCGSEGGLYRYTLVNDSDETETVLIMREDVMRRFDRGWDIDAAPRFPYPDDPYREQDC